MSECKNKAEFIGGLLNYDRVEDVNPNLLERIGLECGATASCHGVSKFFCAECVEEPFVWSMIALASARTDKREYDFSLTLNPAYYGEFKFTTEQRKVLIMTELNKICHEKDRPKWQRCAFYSHGRRLVNEYCDGRLPVINRYQK